MKRRGAKHASDRMRSVLVRTHERLHGTEYELGLSRRANEALVRHSTTERAIARDRQAELADEITMLRRCLYDVERMVGQYAVGAGRPKEYHSRMHDYPDDFEMPKPLDFRELGFDHMRLEEVMRRHSVTMRMMNVKATRDRLASQMHLRVHLAGKGVNYSISEDALFDMPLDILTQRVAEEMADMLIREIRISGKPRTRQG